MIIQIDIPKDISIKLGIHKAINLLPDKKMSVIMILREYFKVNVEYNYLKGVMENENKNNDKT